MATDRRRIVVPDKRLREDIKLIATQFLGVQGGRPPRRHAVVGTPPIGLFFQNISDETIPPYAVMMLDPDLGVEDHDQSYVLRLKKYNQEDESDIVFINGDLPVETKKYGYTQPLGSIYKARIEMVEDVVEVGSLVGPVTGEWKLKKHGPGFMFLGKTFDTNISEEFGMVIPIEPIVYGYPHTEFSAGSLSSPDNLLDVYDWTGTINQSRQFVCQHAYSLITVEQFCAVSLTGGRRVVYPLTCG